MGAQHRKHQRLSAIDGRAGPESPSPIGQRIHAKGVERRCRV